MYDEPTNPWEERARSFRKRPGGVLFKSFPAEVNGALHAWHAAEVRGLVKRVGAANGRVLDIGCGYGRLGFEAKAASASLRIIGLDISPTYARRFRETTGGVAAVSDLRPMPVRPRSFDVVLLVTTLMYLDEADRQRVVEDTLAALRPGGRALVIEGTMTGRWLYTGFGLLTLAARVAGLVDRSVDTGGVVFRRGEIESMVIAAGGRVVRSSGPRRLTLLLPLLLVLYRLGAKGIADRLVAICKPAEGARGWAIHLAFEIASAAEPGIAEAAS